MAKQQQADPHEQELAKYEKELAGYLQERIKPGLNSGAIPLLARSIAKEIAHREHPNGASEDAEAKDEPSAEAEAEAEDEPSAEAEDEDEASAEAEDEESDEDEEEPSAEAEAEDEDEDEEEEAEESAEAEASVFETEMHELQAELGEDWVLSFSVQGDDAWLTAAKDDGTQRVEAPTAAVLSEAVALLNERGGRSA